LVQLGLSSNEIVLAVWEEVSVGTRNQR
jgi:hypothetical protein